MKENTGKRDWMVLFEDLLRSGQIPLAPLHIVHSESQNKMVESQRQVDFLIELVLPTLGDEKFRFAVETSHKSTIQEIERKTMLLSHFSSAGEFPLVVLPYLADDRLKYLEKSGLSGLDLCGNGLVQVPGRFFVLRSGQPNLFPETRPLQNAFKGRSAMVARAFLMQPEFESLSELSWTINFAGAKLSLPQVSKAVSRLEEDAFVEKTDRKLRLRDPVRLLDALARSWKPPAMTRRFVTLPQMDSLPSLLQEASELRWALAGASSVGRYTAFSQGGTPRLMVSNLSLAQEMLHAIKEPVPNFADLELCETREAGYFFAPDVDDKGVHWASRVQTWLELQAGDARQQEAALAVRKRILEKITR